MSTAKFNTWLNPDCCGLTLVNVAGFDGDYKVSTDGRVYSFKYGKCRVLKYSINKKGYAAYKLTKNSISYPKVGHRLVAKAFIENPDGMPEVNHKNGNKLDNSVENLEWCTAKQNKMHAVKMGLWSTAGLAKAMLSGGRAALNVVDVPKIKELRACGMSNRKIAEACGYGRSTIDRYFNGKAKFLKGGVRL